MENILDLFTCIPGLNITVIDAEGRSLYESSELARGMYPLLKWLDIFGLYLRSDIPGFHPGIVSTRFGFFYGIVARPSPDTNRPDQLYILGPVFFTPLNEKQLQDYRPVFEEFSSSVHAWHHFKQILLHLPVSTHAELSRLLLMMHFALTSQRLSLLDVQNIMPTRQPAIHSRRTYEKNLHAAWASHQLLLSEVKHGILHYESETIEQMLVNGSFCLIPTNDSNLGRPQRSRKDSLLILCTLEAAAAIETGVLPERAYQVLDQLIPRIEDSQSMEEMNNIQREFHAEYIRLVQEHRKNAGQYSLSIEKAIHYIQEHGSRPLSLEELADYTGYSVYYLSRQFKKETGTSPKAYHRKIRMKEAATLLTTTSLSLPETYTRLGYTAASRFYDDFQAEYGCSPGRYRSSQKS